MAIEFFGSSARALTVALFALFVTQFVTENAQAQAVRETALPSGKGYAGIAVGPDGTAYIAESNASAIAIVRPDTPVVEARTISGSSRPLAVRMGPDGNVWFVETTAPNVGVMQPDGTMLNEYATRCMPSGYLAVGSGNNLWFTQTCSESGRITSEFITRINTAGTMSLFRIGTDTDPVRLLAGLIEAPDGAIWFIEQNGHGSIGRLNPSTGKYAEYLLSAPSFDPFAIFLGPDGNFWFPSAAGSAYMLNRIDMHGVITHFEWPGDELTGLSIGPDNSFWGVDGEKGVWRVDLAPSGITPKKIPSKIANINAAFMTSDQNQNLWFSEYNGCAFGRIDMDAIFNDNFETCP